MGSLRGSLREGPLRPGPWWAAGHGNEDLSGSKSPVAQGVVPTGLARPSLGGLSGCESSRGEGGCSCPSGIRRGWAIGLAAAATDHTPPARHAGRRGHGDSGAAPASGPLRPAPGPAPPESPQGNPLHALPRPPHRRNEDDSHPHHTGQQPATHHRDQPTTEPPTALVIDTRKDSGQPRTRKAGEGGEEGGGRGGGERARLQEDASGGGAQTLGWEGRRSRVPAGAW